MHFGIGKSRDVTRRVALVEQHGATRTARHAAEAQVRRSLSSSKQQWKLFVINDSFIIFGSAIMLKSLSFCYLRKTLSTWFIVNVNRQTKPNRKFTEENDNNGNGHVGIWARHARLCRACRDVTRRAKWNSRWLIGYWQRIINTRDKSCCVSKQSLLRHVRRVFHSSNTCDGSTRQDVLCTTNRPEPKCISI